MVSIPTTAATITLEPSHLTVLTMDEEKQLLHGSISSSDDPAEKNKSSSSIRNLIGSTICWVAFGLFGWYFPRLLLHRETSISTLKVPYQIAGEDTVIVDFELNNPLVDPPTVDSEFYGVFFNFSCVFRSLGLFTLFSFFKKRLFASDHFSAFALRLNGASRLEQQFRYYF